MSERRAQIHTAHALPKRRRCELLDVARSTAYDRPDPFGEEDLALMRRIDEIHLKWPFYGSRRIRDELCQRRREFVPVRRSKSVPSGPPRRDSVGMRREGITGRGVRYQAPCWAVADDACSG